MRTAEPMRVSILTTQLAGLLFGVPTAEQAEMETLAAQLRDAVVSQRSVTRAIDLVSAWTRRDPTGSLAHPVEGALRGSRSAYEMGLSRAVV